MNAPRIVSSWKERSISALVVSTPKVSAQAGIRRRRSKGGTRKDLRGNHSLAEGTMRKAESSFREELMSGEPEGIVPFGKVSLVSTFFSHIVVSCVSGIDSLCVSGHALLVPDQLAQENKELRHTVSVVSDALMASKESLKKLSAEKKSADVRLGEMEELKSLLAARDRELEAKDKELEAGSLLIRAREDEVCSLGARVESLQRERDEAVEKADRLGKELQECKSKGRLKDGSSASEDLKHMCHEFVELEKDMELAVIAACITTRYQVCREWESQGTLRWELEFSAEDYHKFREFVDKNGTSYKYPLLEVYEEKWRKFVACHRPSESHSTLDRENISSPTSNSNLHLDAPGSGTSDHFGSSAPAD